MKELSLITVAKKCHWREIIPISPTTTPQKCLENYSLNLEINHIRGHKSCAVDLQQARLAACWPERPAAFASRALPALPALGSRPEWTETSVEPIIRSVGLLGRALCQVWGGALFPLALIFSPSEKLCPPWHVEAGSPLEFGEPSPFMASLSHDGWLVLSLFKKKIMVKYT